MEDENVMKILVASDTHLGYKEKDSVREKDSFTTFEEIFVIAKEKNVDFVLLGGDLFHENKPSRKTLHSCMEIMRKHCLGNRPCQVEIVSDQSIDFGHTSRTITSVNYEDPNMNISMPVFSIHGNHDDPAGTGSLSAIDLLSVAGLLNHFGKSSNLEEINISPVLLQKGTTKLALYGLGSIRDERLHRLFSKERVTFLRPKENTEEWFNIMVIHQNRAKHGATNYIPEDFLDDFLDLVIWGHEHECRVDPEWNSIRNFFVVQPGSPVATSLSPGESKKKHVALLSIRGREMKVEAIPLQTVRNMYVEDIVLSQVSSLPPPQQPFTENAIQVYCQERVESLVEKSADEMSGHPKQPEKPLIRLRIDTAGGYPTFNPYRLGAKFSETVANADSIIHFMKKSLQRHVKGEKYDMSDMDDLVVNEVVDKVKVEDLVQEYLTSKEKKYQMSLLSAKGMSLAVREYVEKKEKDAIYDLCEHQLNTISNHLKQQPTMQLQQDSIVDEVARFKEERKMSDVKGDGTKLENGDDFHDILARVKQNRVSQGVTIPTIDSDEEIMNLADDDEVPERSKRGGRGGRRGSRGGTSKARGRGKGSRGGRSSKNALPVSEVTRKAANIMDAFKMSSQQSRNVVDITVINDSDDEPPMRGSASTHKPTKRGRGGVDFSSDEENPFDAVVKRRR